MLILAAVMAMAAGSEQPVAPPPPAEPDKPPSVSELVVTAPLRPPEPDWARKLNFDVKGRYIRPSEPYLRRRPTNGCKAMAGGATSPSGKAGVAAGVVCSRSF